MNEKKVKRKGDKRNELFFLLVFFIFSLLTILLGILCLNGAESHWIERRFLWLSIGVCGLATLLCGLFVWFTLSRKETLIKMGVSIYALLLFFLVVCFTLQRTGFFKIVKTAEGLEAYIKKAGVWMPIFYIVLQFLQVVILPIPSIVSTAAGVALFGSSWALLYSMVGILSGSILAFFIGRKLGGRAVSWIVGKENLEKWQKKCKGKDNIFLSLMFILPFFPDDVLCFLAGLSSMTTQYFLIVIFISRLVGIAATCYSIDLIPFNTWWGIMLWVLFIVGIVIAIIVLYKNIDKIQRYLHRKKKKSKEEKKSV